MIYICLLRGINVGGNKRIKMADLLDLLATIGLQNAKTILQSGNVVFESDEASQNKLIDKIETAIKSHYSFDVTVMLRTAAEWQALIANKPEYKIEVAGNRLLLACLDTAPTPENISALKASAKDEIIHMLETDMYIYFPNGMSKSKLNIDSKLKVTSTARNWNTVLKLQALIEQVTTK